MSDGVRVRLGDLGDLKEGDMQSCPAGGIEVLVCRVGGSLYAIEDVCSHADTPLSEGLLYGHLVTCPLHGAQFDVRDGTHKGPPAYTGVRTFPVIEAADGVSIEIADAPKRDAGYGPPDGYFQTR